jgi:hypothetical protein
MASIVETIRQRHSCRNFQRDGMDSAIRKILVDFLEAEHRGPFGNPIVFRLIDLSEEGKDGKRKLGTYGVIRHAQTFVAGVVQKEPNALEDFGWAMERVILFATQHGLGTCWLGGTFSRSGFGQALRVRSDEILPAVTPVGLPAGKRTLTDLVFRFSAGSARRKDWNFLFFDGTWGVPLALERAGTYATALESVRLAPSASNRQPWRVIKEPGRPVFHFAADVKPVSMDPYCPLHMFRIDLGIAMCHFELCARESGIEGHWDPRPEIRFDSLGKPVIASWVETGRKKHAVRSRTGLPRTKTPARNSGKA